MGREFRGPAGARPVRVWLGAGVRTFARLVWRNRFAISPGLLHVAAADGAVSLLNSALGALEAGLFRRELRRPPEDPVFVLGHWRSGTSLLQNLLSLHPRLTTPTLYETVAPHHFLLTSGVFPHILRHRVPPRRPMDDMRLDLNSPSEDEFALCLLGARSPYETLAFPNRGPMTPEMFDPSGFAPDERSRWRDAMRLFAAKVALRRPGRRLVLKSPPHTCRIPTLLELFPRASFVHIVRDPYEVYPSMVHTWRRMHETQGWQRPDGRGLEEMVLTLFVHFFECFERDRARIPEGRLHQVRYEELVADPVSTMDRLRSELELTSEDELRRAVEEYFDERSGYRPNEFRMDPRETRRVTEWWGEIAERRGYAA